MPQNQRPNGNSDRLYCFSPPVMLATFAIEILLSILVLLRYSTKDLKTRLAVALLFLLALFQLAEYKVCGGFGLNALTWSRIGFASITLLPVIGMHLIFELAEHKNRTLLYVVYGTAIAIAGVFLFVPSSVNAQLCAGNYIIFRLQRNVNVFYGFYYDFLLLLGAGLSLYYFVKSNKPAIKNSLFWSFIGYLVFMVPTGVVYWLNPHNLGLPSIMCGFAIFYALILVFLILPKRLPPKK